MKKILIVTSFLYVSLAGASHAVAEEVTDTSVPETFRLGNEVRYLDRAENRAENRTENRAERAVYRTERRERVQSMTQEERQAMRLESGGRSRAMAGAEQGRGSMTRSRRRDGSGGGNGRRNGGGGRWR